MNRILHRLRRLGTRWVRRTLKPFPYEITLRKLVYQGCIFEISNDLEEARVLTLDNEEEFIRLLLNRIQPRDIFFDIGACLGLFSIHAAAKGAEVIAFEPDPSYRQRLNRNININGLHNSIKVHNCAVSDQEGEIILYTDGINGKSPSLYQIGNRDKIKVSTCTIDKALHDRSLPFPTIIKMDIEGAEILALNGMKEMLRSINSPKSLFIELHPEHLIGFRSSPSECISIIENAGFKEEYSNIRDGQLHYVYSK